MTKKKKKDMLFVIVNDFLKKIEDAQPRKDLLISRTKTKEIVRCKSRLYNVRLVSNSNIAIRKVVQLMKEFLRDTMDLEITTSRFDHVLLFFKKYLLNYANSSELHNIVF